VALEGSTSGDRPTPPEVGTQCCRSLFLIYSRLWGASQGSSSVAFNYQRSGASFTHPILPCLGEGRGQGHRALTEEKQDLGEVPPTEPGIKNSVCPFQGSLRSKVPSSNLL
jgi:hypothetical protein